MNYFETRSLIALANFALCCMLMWMCLCRINRMHVDTTRRDFRFMYCILLAASFASAFSPVLFDEWPTAVQLFLTSAFLTMMWTSRKEWTGGNVPLYAHRGGTFITKVINTGDEPVDARFLATVRNNIRESDHRP